MLGVADARLLEETVDAVAAGDSRARAAARSRSAPSRAATPPRSPRDLEVRARELLVVQTLGEVPAELSLTPEADAALLAQAERVDHAAVVRLLELLGEAMEAVRAGADARTRLELALVKAARPEVDGSMRALLARIERLEHERRPPCVARRPSLRLSGCRAEPAAPPARATAPPPPLPLPPPRRRHPPRAAPQPPADRAAAARRADGRDGADAGARAMPTPAPSNGRAPAAPPLDGEPPELAGGDLEGALAVWPAVVDLVRCENALLGALIAEARPVAVARRGSHARVRRDGAVPEEEGRGPGQPR